MESTDSLILGVEGPIVEDRTGKRTYTVRSMVTTMQFRVLPEERKDRHGWGVDIDGVPAPGIVHESPWETADEAYEAAVKACEAMLVLERMQQEELERARA